jgi:hypothetical protein
MRPWRWGTKDQLQALIDKTITNGESVQQLGKAIKEFAIDGLVRPLRIARTELADTINDGTSSRFGSKAIRRRNGRRSSTDESANCTQMRTGRRSASMTTSGLAGLSRGISATRTCLPQCASSADA